MGIIYIGHREAGKTHLAMELANPQFEYVKVVYPEYDYLKSNLYDAQTKSTRPTETNKVHNRDLDIQIRLPSGNQSLEIQWIDTAGEIWRRYWQNANLDKWNDFLNEARSSEGIILILEPYRDILKSEVERKDFITKQQWYNRFALWVDFFQNQCPQARRLAICLNKADLFCDIETEAKRLAYSPSGALMDWQQRHTYVLKRYFKPVQPQLQKLSRSNYNLSISCFITSIYQRKLLELPWIYLGTYLN